MENVLNVYEKEYTSKHPVVCFDERPSQLIDDVLVPTPVAPGKPKREDYHLTNVMATVLFYCKSSVFPTFLNFHNMLNYDL